MRDRPASFANLGTKLLALLIAVAMWFGVSWQRRERISERGYRLPLSVANIPAKMLISSPLPAGVDVRLRGPFTALRQLDPQKLEAVLDLSNAPRGTRVYRLGPEDVNAPPEIEVVSVAPDELTVRLEPAVEKSVPIAPDLTGEPSEGLRVSDFAVDPPVALVVGPESSVAKLTQVRTEPISVAGRRATFATAAAVIVDAPGVRLRQGAAVTVTVRLAPVPPPEETPAKPRGKRK
jgi:YbbR domain-containing protein